MARLRNATTGVIVEVRDDKVERLGAGWEPVAEERSTTTRKTTRRTAKSSDGE